MKSVIGIVGGFVVGAALGAGVVSIIGKNKGAKNAGTVGGLGSDVALFVLDGAKFTSNDLPADVRSQLFDLQTEAFDRTNNLLNQFALQKSLAKEKGKDSTGPLPPFEELLDAPAPTEAEMTALFEANKERLPANTTFEQIKGDIERYIKNQKVSEQLRAKNEEFKSKNRLQLLTQAPVAPQFSIDTTPYLAKGTATAPNTLVEVADYLCPHCQALAGEVSTLVKDMGDKFKFVPITYSLRPEGLSGTLARGAYCARQQGDENFWKWHETAFRVSQAKGWKATDPDAKEPALEVAKEAGIDTAKFEACLPSPEAQVYVKKIVDSMQQLGVNGTPTFFVNGRRVQIAGKPLREAITAGLSASH